MLSTRKKNLQHLNKKRRGKNWRSVEDFSFGCSGVPEKRGFGGRRMAGRGIGVLPCCENFTKHEQGRSGRAVLYRGSCETLTRRGRRTPRARKLDISEPLQAGRPRRWAVLTTRNPREPRREAPNSGGGRTPTDGSRLGSEQSSADDSRLGNRRIPRRTQNYILFTYWRK